MVFEVEIKNGILRMNCLGSIYGASLEDSEEIFSRIVDELIKHPSVSSIVLSETREYEYDYSQARMLVEIADAIKTIVRERRLTSIRNFPKCPYTPSWFNWVNALVNVRLKKDPIGAYVTLIREIRHVKIKAEKAHGVEKEWYKHYLEQILLPIKEILEKCKLIQIAKPRILGYHIGDRSLYREVFHPSIRPNFMYTKYLAQPPHGEVVQRYRIGETEIEIFRIPEKARYFYFVVPPEFKLAEDDYMLLDAARRILEERRPKEFEIKDQSRLRETFLNIGQELLRDLAEESGVAIPPKRLRRLAEILARYTAGFGILEVLLEDEKIQDIYINAPLGNSPIFVFHEEFEECETNLISTSPDGERWATRFRLLSGRPFDEANPVLDAELEVIGGKARIALIRERLSPDGIALAIRRHRDKPWTYPLFLKRKYLNELFAGFMSFIIDYGRSFLIAGGRGSGKTSLLGASMLEILPRYRIITLEDTLELPVTALRKIGYNIERLKARSVITHVETELPAEEALRTALRLGDSCLIVGEVRSTEAKALYEAMRIGALANVVAGTIHGESAYGVFDRVVNDLGVPPTSFKATDLIIICNRLRTPDGLHMFRRVVEVVEVRKHWKSDPLEENGFVTLMRYSAKEDTLKPSDVLLNGESWVLNQIAERIREWSGNWAAVWENILLRGKILSTIVEYSEKLQKPELLEAKTRVKANEMFHLIAENIKKEIGTLDSKRIYDEWVSWFKDYIKSG